jgi:hypothetical protein
MTVELDGISADATALPDDGPAAAPAAPEPAPQSELTTRDIIRAAVEKQKAGEDGSAEPAPRTDGRAADGRFAPAATHGADGKPLVPARAAFPNSRFSASLATPQTMMIRPHGALTSRTGRFSGGKWPPGSSIHTQGIPTRSA